MPAKTISQLTQATTINGTDDFAIEQSGVTKRIAASVVRGDIANANISASAAIAHSKLAALNSGQILVGNGSNVPTAVSVTGDVTISNAGVTAIAAGAVAGSKLTDGMVVRVVHASTNATTDITANIPSDDTIPQNTEGSEILTATITPTSSTNKVLVSVVVNGTTIGAVSYNAAVFKDSTANAIAAARNYGEGYTYQTTIQYYDSPATTSAVTYKVRCGASSGTFYLNQNNGDVGMFGGACHSTLTLTEIKAS